MILDKIVASTRRSLAHRQEQTPMRSLKAAVDGMAPPRDFAGALRGNDIRLIAEIKRASPSRGALNPDMDAAKMAQAYKRGGASAISVLTETDHFKGCFADMEAVRAAVDLPLLCKDFIIDPYQVYEARSHGADAVLLIVTILDHDDLASLLKAAHSLGMAALVETHNRKEMMAAIKVSPRVIGINNRNLADFSVSLETTVNLRPLIPPGVILVSESGIHNRSDVIRLEEAGVNAILVGESLVTSPNPAAKIRELLGQDT